MNLMDTTFLIGLAYVLLGFYMVWQQFKIARALGDDDGAWARTVALYRKQFQLTKTIGYFLGVMSAVIVALLLLPFPQTIELARAWARLLFERERLPLVLAMAFVAALMSEWMNRELKKLNQELATSSEEGQIDPPNSSSWMKRLRKQILQETWFGGLLLLSFSVSRWTGGHPVPVKELQGSRENVPTLLEAVSLKEFVRSFSVEHGI